MAFSLKPEYLKRYKDFAWLLMKYGRSDLVSQIGLDAVLVEDEKPVPVGESKADELAKDLEAMGPTFVKLGQFLSTRPDLIPANYVDALSRLQDKVEPIPFAVIEETISTELGVRISKAFNFFDHKPLAAASLSQVHLAELRDGRKVAVKVQRPNIRAQILQDLEVLSDIAHFFQENTEAGRRFRPHTTVEEFRKAIIRELDFSIEVRNLNQLRKNLSDFVLIVVPEPIEDYCTSRVLTMDFIQGKKVTSLTPLGRMEINGGALAEQLFRAYLRQILLDGFYHADPHPGNIFLTDDGRIALIDLGMVGYVSNELQKKLLQILIDFSEGRGEEVAKHIIEISDVGERLDDASFSQKIGELVATYSNLPLEQMDVGRALLEASKIAGEYHIRFPNEMAMLGKTMLSLDKVGKTLKPDFNPNESIRKYSQQLFQKKLERELNSRSLINALLESKDLITKLPRRLNKFVEDVSEGKFRINVDALDEVYLMSGFQKIANRVTMGLIIAAMIISAALMMDVATTFTIFELPGIAMILFLLSGFASVIMGVQILYKDERTKKKRG
ncbi:MAG: ABC1 kinase family protein [Chloroflexota bacterium]